MCCGVPVPEPRTLLNPHLLSLGVLPDEPGIFEIVAPESLISGRRFGTLFKYLYAQAYLLGCRSSYPLEQYERSIECITQGACREDDGSKHCLADYASSFNALLASMRSHGWQGAPVPVDRNYTPIDGTHRVAAALALNLPVPVLRFSHEGPSYPASLFENCDCDRAAVEYCKLRPNARIMVLFGEPCPTFPFHGLSVVTVKRFSLPSPVAQENLITELYLGESWLGDSAAGFRGSPPKARPCFARGNTVEAVLVDGPADWVSTNKNSIRQQTGYRDCVHATDTQAETVRVARVLFSDNSLRFLERPWKHMPRLEELLGQYRAVIGDTDQDLLCVDGSAVLARYGLREPADLDFVHAVTVPTTSRVSSHNDYSCLYPFSKDELIFDPDSYFWSHGVKYATMDKVREVKMAIVDDKNRMDLKLMDGS